MDHSLSGNNSALKRSIAQLAVDFTLLSCQLFQPPRCLVQCLRLFAEGETYLLGSVLWMLVKTRSGHAGDADVLDQVGGELHVVGEAEGADVGHHVIRAPRTVADEAGLLERGNQVIAARAIAFRQFAVVTDRQA